MRGGGGARGGSVGLGDGEGVAAFAVVARGPFEADVWVGGGVVVGFCGV